MGGVASHYKGLRAFWTENVMYNTIGKRNATKCGSGKYWLLWDCLKFISLNKVKYEFNNLGT